MPESKKRKYQRKQEKRYEMLKFSSELFEDEFVFPNPKQMDMKTVSSLEKGDFDAIAGWLKEAGVDPDAIEAFGTLDRTEIPGFMEVWSDGVISVPKS